MGWATCVWPIPRSSAQPFTLECNHTYSVHVCSIASVLKAQGKYDAALDMYNKSLEIKIKVLGHEHPDTTLIQKKYTSMHACVCIMLVSLCMACTRTCMAASGMSILLKLDIHKHSSSTARVSQLKSEPSAMRT